MTVYVGRSSSGTGWQSAYIDLIAPKLQEIQGGELVNPNVKFAEPAYVGFHESILATETEVKADPRFVAFVNAYVLENNNLQIPPFKIKGPVRIWGFVYHYFAAVHLLKIWTLEPESTLTQPTPQTFPSPRILSLGGGGGGPQRYR
jgi:hypothetical protein